MPKRLGIMGGTFDPIHNAHIEVARAVADALQLERVLFIPTGNPHFKLDQKVTPADQRVRMVELAIAGESRFQLDLREVEREGVTYTVDTLRELQREYPGAELCFIMGADSAETLVKWRSAAEIAKLCTVVVTSRPGVDLQRVRQIHAESDMGFKLEFVDVPQIDISSTELRERLACGQSVEDFVPAPVIAYIETTGLYKS